MFKRICESGRPGKLYARLYAKKRLIWTFIPNVITGVSVASILLAPTAGYPDITPGTQPVLAATTSSTQATSSLVSSGVEAGPDSGLQVIQSGIKEDSAADTAKNTAPSSSAGGGKGSSHPKKKVEMLTVEETEARVRAYFKAIPILAEVARCESHFRQYNEDGSIHRGRNRNGTHDIGVMQINDETWLLQAKKLGLNLLTLKGNIAFAKWLYAQEGLQPWMSSSLCWAKAPQIADNQ